MTSTRTWQDAYDLMRKFGFPATWDGDDGQLEAGYFIAIPWDQSVDRLFEVAKLMEDAYTKEDA